MCRVFLLPILNLEMTTLLYWHRKQTETLILWVKYLATWALIQPKNSIFIMAHVEMQEKAMTSYIACKHQDCNVVICKSIKWVTLPHGVPARPLRSVSASSPAGEGDNSKRWKCAKLNHQTFTDKTNIQICQVWNKLNIISHWKNYVLLYKTNSCKIFFLTICIPGAH